MNFYFNTILKLIASDLVICWANKKGSNPQHSGTSDGIYFKLVISEMEAKISELDGKFKALNMILEKTNDTVTERNKALLLRNERSINNKVAALYVLKEEIEEFKFINKESEENVREWPKGIETKLNDVYTHLTQVRDTLDQINNEGYLRPNKQ